MSMPSQSTRTVDVAIIGAGTAGLSALREVRKRTENFVIINAGAYGTTCARNGCMPSKTLIEASRAFHARRRFEQLGIRGADRLSVDIEAVLRHVRELRDDFVAGVLKLTADLGERSLAGTARFVAPQTLEVNGSRIEAHRVIVAVGSRPVVPPAWHALGHRVLTSDDLFEQAALPKRMAVVGLGGVGAEMAQALARLDIEVSGFAASPHVAGLTDPEVARHAVAALEPEIGVHLGVTAELHPHGDGVEVRAGEVRVVVDKVLAALGRRPNLDGLGLEQAGVALGDKGLPEFDVHTMQIAGHPIFIAGDANADRALLHEATDEGYIAGYNATRDAAEYFRRRAPLAIVFTDPDIAVVGRRFDALEGELKAGRIAIGSFDFGTQGRARITGGNRGIVRIYVERDDGRVLGAELCVPGGEHLAHLLAWAVQSGMRVHDLLRMPVYHPVIEEGLRAALRNAGKQLDPGVRHDLEACGALGCSALD